MYRQYCVTIIMKPIVNVHKNYELVLKSIMKIHSYINIFEISKSSHTPVRKVTKHQTSHQNSSIANAV